MRNQALSKKYHIRVTNIVTQEKANSSSKEFVKGTQFKFTPMKKFFQKIYVKWLVKIHWIYSNVKKVF